MAFWVLEKPSLGIGMEHGVRSVEAATRILVQAAAGGSVQKHHIRTVALAMQIPESAQRLGHLGNGSGALIPYSHPKMRNQSCSRKWACLEQAVV